MLAISPYARRHAVSHSHYSTVSVLETMSQLLGIENLTYLDERAGTELCDLAVR